MFYSNELVNNLTLTSIYIANCFYFEYNLSYLGNFLKALYIFYNDIIYIAGLDLVIKKLLKKIMYFFSIFFNYYLFF